MTFDSDIEWEFDGDDEFDVEEGGNDLHQPSIANSSLKIIINT